MKKLGQMKSKIAGALIAMSLAPWAWADQQLQLNNISGTSGAGSSDLTAWFTKIGGYFQSGITLVLMGFTAFGVFLCGVSIHKVYAANKDQREPPKLAIIGIIVGALMTIVPVVIGILRNSATPG